MLHWPRDNHSFDVRICSSLRTQWAFEMNTSSENIVGDYCKIAETSLQIFFLLDVGAIYRRAWADQRLCSVLLHWFCSDSREFSCFQVSTAYLNSEPFQFGFVGYAAFNGSIYRTINGVDDCGNICGMKNDKNSLAFCGVSWSTRLALWKAKGIYF